MEGIAKRLAAYNPSRFVYHETVKRSPATPWLIVLYVPCVIRFYRFWIFFSLLQKWGKFADGTDEIEIGETCC